MILNRKLAAFPRPAWWGGILVAIALGLALQGDAGRRVDRLFVSLIEVLQQNRAERPQAALSDYHVRVEARPVEGVTGKLSGLARDERREQLWSVASEPPQLLALSTDGDVLARHPLDGFENIKGVAWLGDDRLLLVEEGRQALVVLPVPGSPGQALSRRGRQALTLAMPDGGNQGFAGVAYDRDGDRLFVLTGHSPRKLYEIRGLRGSLDGRRDVEIIDRKAWTRDKFVARDFSSVEYDARTGHVILLSDASRQVIELDEAGRFVGYQPLAGGFAGLREHVRPGAGMSLDERGKLYVLSEPGLFYAFDPD